MPKQIGYAVVGLGDLVPHAVLPAFARAGEHARLTAIVAADRARAQALAQSHRAAAYGLDELRQCLQRDDVNAVFLAVPNALRCEYAVEAARAGVHVLCDKPMAVTADECRRMIRTAQTNRVKLMVGYRLHFHPAHGRVVELVRQGALGTPKTLLATFTMRLEDHEDVRLQRRQGGGTVYELGVDCLNTARRLFGRDAAQVMAMTARPTRRATGDVDEGTVALVRFPEERLAQVHTSFGEERTAELVLLGEEGVLRLSNAFEHAKPMRLDVVRGGRVEETHFEPIDQFAAEIAYFSDCILNDRAPEPSGIEGLQDVRIVEAIYRSARDGRPVTLPLLERAERPPVAPPELRRPVAERRQAS